jgi:hypothetical protein
MEDRFHDTAHVEKRARERGFSVEQAVLTVNDPGSILKRHRARETMADSFGCSSAGLKVEFWSSSPK